MSLIYTVGAAARLCGVAPRTVAKWIDKGLLRGYRIPGSQDRRVTHTDLLDFMRVNKMASVLLNVESSMTVLLCGVPKHTATELEKVIKEGQFVRRTTAVGVGRELANHPRVVIVDGSMGSSTVREIVNEALSLVPMPFIIVLPPEDAGKQTFESSVVCYKYPINFAVLEEAVRNTLKCLPLENRSTLPSSRRQKTLQMGEVP